MDSRCRILQRRSYRMPSHLYRRGSRQALPSIRVSAYGALLFLPLIGAALLRHPASGLLPRGSLGHWATGTGTGQPLTQEQRPLKPAVKGGAQRKALKILFIGNSWTYYNHLPTMLYDMSVANPAAVLLNTTQQAKPAYTLMQHASDPEVKKLLDGHVKWDYVILQEQSRTLARDMEYIHNNSIPYIRVLAKRIRAIGSKPLLFLTWAYRFGDPYYSHYGKNNKLILDTYEEMQQRQIVGYTEAAKNVSAHVVPVGIAWRRYMQLNKGNTTKQAMFWQKDGMHPTVRGSYLAACVFFMMLENGMSPIGNTYRARLDATTAKELQSIAQYAIRHNPMP